MDLRYIVDVSSFFLVESSGDSEGNLDSVSSMDCNIASAENDAESCCRSSDVACMDDCNEINDQDYSEEDDHSEDDDATSADRYRDVGNGNWTWQEMGLLLDDTSGSSIQTEEKNKQPKVRADVVSADIMNEEEQNRLFWDTCLAL